jgi:large subunit ribosomal protein L6
MSRVGKSPITLPAGVTVTQDGRSLTVKGPKGQLTVVMHPDIAATIADNVITCSIERPSKQANALWGTMRALLAKAVAGVQTGFTKKLEMQGVGYRAAKKGNDLELSIGFSHPVLIKAPEGISFTVEKEIITIEGIDAYMVGQMAANIRAVRPPEPYKGKGIRYQGEIVKRKQGKVVGATA